ncbi:MAG: hypothetical protein Q9196_007090, partial [Gyalolechia fulgens]
MSSFRSSLPAALAPTGLRNSISPLPPMLPNRPPTVEDLQKTIDELNQQVRKLKEDVDEAEYDRDNAQAAMQSLQHSTPGLGNDVPDIARLNAELTTCKSQLVELEAEQEAQQRPGPVGPEDESTKPTYASAAEKEPVKEPTPADLIAEAVAFNATQSTAHLPQGIQEMIARIDA